MFTVNHKDVYEGNGLMKEGEYEVIVKTAGEMVTPGGTVYFSVDLVVRNDIEQQYKNKHLFHAIWKTKATGEYNFTNFNTICKAFKIPEGTTFIDLDELALGIRGKLSRVMIKHDTYKDKTTEKVVSWGETKFPECKHEFKTTEAVKNEPAENPDDLPF